MVPGAIRSEQWLCGALNTVAELEKCVRLLIRVCGNFLLFLYAHFLPFLSRDWTLALRTVLWIERAEGKIKRRNLSVVFHCLQDLFVFRVFVPDPGEGVPARYMVGELDLLGLFGSELGNSFRFSASSHHVL